MENAHIIWLTCKWIEIKMSSLFSEIFLPILRLIQSIGVFFSLKITTNLVFFGNLLPCSLCTSGVLDLDGVFCAGWIRAAFKVLAEMCFHLDELETDLPFSSSRLLQSPFPHNWMTEALTFYWLSAFIWGCLQFPWPPVILCSLGLSSAQLLYSRQKGEAIKQVALQDLSNVM